MNFDRSIDWTPLWYFSKYLRATVDGSSRFRVSCTLSNPFFCCYYATQVFL